MKDLLLYIARNLVDHPEAVTVTEVPGQEEITLELRVAPEDMGKVIGRQAASPRRSALWYAPMPSAPEPRFPSIL